MKTKILIAVTCMVILQLTIATAQISTGFGSGNFGTTFSVSIGTNPYQNNAYDNYSNNCGGNYNQYPNNWNSNNSCNHHHVWCHKHKHKHKCNKHHDSKKSKCCKKHDD